MQGLSEPGTPRVMSRVASSAALDSSTTEDAPGGAALLAEPSTSLPMGIRGSQALPSDLPASSPPGASPLGWPTCGSSTSADPGRQQHGFWAPPSSTQVCQTPFLYSCFNSVT